ncbi:EAL domain-containing protein [Yokenella regensburgei]|uniref:bifunctional diguanylate cyclase/phosphodiesterase n=1 Tax=Yokenella regensburgei TaxID=158877 RepID=UPI003F167CB4
MSLFDNRTPPSLDGKTQEILQQITLLIPGLMIFIFLTIILTLVQIKKDLNHYDYNEKSHLITKSLDNRQENLRLHLTDNANWNEAYDNLSSTVNKNWAWNEQNFGSSLYSKFNYEGVFILSPDGKTQYSIQNGQLSTVPMDKWLGKDISRSLFAALDESKGKTISKLININGQVALVAAAWIVRENIKFESYINQKNTLMIFFDILTPVKMQKLGDEYGITDLHLISAHAADPILNQSKICTSDIEECLTVAWQSKSPSEHLLYWVIPLLILFMVTAALFALHLTRKAMMKARLNDEQTFLLEQSRSELLYSEQRFKDVVDATTDWIWEANPSLKITWISARFPLITGYSINEWLQRSLIDFFEDNHATIKGWLTPTQSGNCLSLSHCRYVSATGNNRYCNLTIKRARLPDGTMGFRGTASDVTHEVEANERIRFLSHHDALTGLPNRVMMQEFLTGKLQSRSEAGNSLVMLSLDLTDFKSVNDLYGHAAGDIVLSEVADRLRHCLSDSDMVTRQGGDEFIIIVSDPSQDNDIDALCQRIIDSVSKPYHVYNNQIFVGVNIGCARSPQDALTANDLLIYSDIALYKSKNKGGNSYEIYQSDMFKQIIQRREMESDLREAIEKDQLFLVYQPKFDIKKSCMTSVEALVRWRHPRHGVIMPDQFISLAEETGIITSITDWVLENACKEVAQTFDKISLSVNISPLEFKTSDVILRIKKALMASSLSSSRLELEVTENITLCKPERALQIMQELKEMGIRLVIDDFGTGFTSLYHLHSFPFHGIKIDKSFIFAMNDSQTAKNIVEKIIGISKDYNMEVTAEGVETQEQLLQLKKYNCDIAQGYYFSRPTSLEVIRCNMYEKEAYKIVDLLKCR